MTQAVILSIGGSDVTEYLEKFSATYRVGNIYDVAVIDVRGIDVSSWLENDVVLVYGDKTFNGFVHNPRQTERNAYAVECRTYSARLTEPYSPSVSTIDDAKTSHDLCDLYASQSGIPIVNSCANLYFGGSYERDGTMLSALSNIAAVTGAELWHEDGTVYLTPNKAISENGEPVKNDEIIEYVEENRTVDNDGVGIITVSNVEGDTDDIVSENSIYVEVDECHGTMEVYTNPAGYIDDAKGCIVRPGIVKRERTQSEAVTDEVYITLDAPVAGVESVTLNGIEVTDYSFSDGHNPLWFSEPKRGSLHVIYTAYCQTGKCNIEQTPAGRFISFDLFYLDQTIAYQAILSEDCDGLGSSDGDMECLVPSQMIYPKGFTVYTMGGDPVIDFYNGPGRIFRQVVTQDADYISVESVTLEPVDDGYIYRTNYPIGEALTARSAGKSVQFTTGSDDEGDFYEFTKYYPRVEVSYTTPATEHYVQFDNILEGNITMVITNRNTSETCEYVIEGIDYDDINQIPCALDQLVPVDVAGILGVSVTEVYMVQIPYTDPLGATGNVTVDSHGLAHVYVDRNGDYILDVKNVAHSTSTVEESYIILTANVNLTQQETYGE